MATRLAYCEKIDAVILSLAGLIRLNINKPYYITSCPADQFYPAPGQGVIALQTRTNDNPSKLLANMLSDPHQTQISQIELAILKNIQFNCELPFGLYTHINKKVITCHYFLQPQKGKSIQQTLTKTDANTIIHIISEQCRNYI